MIRNDEFNLKLPVFDIVVFLFLILSVLVSGIGGTCTFCFVASTILKHAGTNMPAVLIDVFITLLYSESCE